MVEPGQRYVALKVIERHDREGAARWVCRCDCTRYRVCFEADLVEGRVAECVHCEKWREMQTFGVSPAGGYIVPRIRAETSNFRPPRRSVKCLARPHVRDVSGWRRGKE